MQRTHPSKIDPTRTVFAECLPEERQIPARITAKPQSIHIEVADNLKEAGTRTKQVGLHVHLENLTVVDQLEVKLNGEVLACENPMEPGGYNTRGTAWKNFNVPPSTVRCGNNEVILRLTRQNECLAKELPVQIADMELAIEYDYPDGPWDPPPPGYTPRT